MTKVDAAMLEKITPIRKESEFFSSLLESALAFRARLFSSR